MRRVVWENTGGMMQNLSEKVGALARRLRFRRAGHEASGVSYQVTRGVFLRGLAAVYFVAFVSFWTQVDGLVGRGGILPQASFLSAVDAQVSGPLWWACPTFSWLSSSDASLHVQCGLGVLFALLLLLGRAPVLGLTALWLLYLSLVTVGQKFMSYQWDSLLLEVGFLAIFFAPLRLRPGTKHDAPPAWLPLFLLRLLLFKLMFLSGVVKLISGDTLWRNLTALTVHYETQPIPTATAWFAHHLPVWFHQFSCGAMFAIELVVPFFIFGPRRGRQVAFCALVGLQVMIIFTGNYTFFNYLTLVLCIPLLDDVVWPKAWRSRHEKTAGGQGRFRGWWPYVPLAPLSVVIALITTMVFLGAFRVRVNWPQPIVSVYQAAGPFRSCNGYGLFAVMTPDRPEITVEGSYDGQDWEAYVFRWKPGPLERPPSFVAPHQPRLDWQMWFAALGSAQGNPWFLNFAARLLQGSPDVLELLAHNPFPERPPTVIRALRYDYRFADPSARRSEGVWWTREFGDVYLAPVSLGPPRGGAGEK